MPLSHCLSPLLLNRYVRHHISPNLKPILKRATDANPWSVLAARSCNSCSTAAHPRNCNTVSNSQTSCICSHFAPTDTRGGAG